MARPASKSKTKAKAKAKAKPKTKAKAKTKAEPKAKAKPRARAKAKRVELPDATVIPASPIETEIAALLARYDSGRIDNAWDVLPRMGELTVLLPQTSALRADFDRMFAEMIAIAQEIS